MTDQSIMWKKCWYTKPKVL